MFTFKAKGINSSYANWHNAQAGPQATPNAHLSHIAPKTIREIVFDIGKFRRAYDKKKQLDANISICAMYHQD